MKPRPAWARAFLTMLLLVPGFPAATAETAQDRYPPGRYEVDLRRTIVHFQVKSLFGSYQGDFAEPTGTVIIDPARPGHANIDVSFPVSRLTTGDASTDQMLKGSSFFDMERYPTIRFAADDAPISGGETLKVEGKLTMHGQTRSISVTARFAGVTAEQASDQPSLRFTGEASVKRSLFGMGFGRPFVANRVDLTVDATFRRASSTTIEPAANLRSPRTKARSG